MISTKQNARKLEFSSKNKNPSKEAAELVENRKKHEQLEFKHREAVNTATNLLATFQEQNEKKVFLNQKIQKWTQRCETYEKPFSEKVQLKALTEKVKAMRDTITKEEVGFGESGTSTYSHGQLEECFRNRAQNAEPDGRDDGNSRRPA